MVKISKQQLVWAGVAVVVVAVLIGIHIHSSSASRLGGSGQCNDNYTGTCVPNVSYDIDCKDIRHKVRVVGKDVYHFDADHNGVGCESY
jgi:hypothetical protein